MPDVRNAGLEPAKLWRWLLMAGFILIVAVNLPGHLSTDSVIALKEGRTGIRVSWGPPMYSSIVGFFDHILPGASLYIVASVLLLLGSWAAMATVRSRMSWIAPALLLAVLATPQLLIYQGIVWKDVLFANFAVAGFVALACAHASWGTRRSKWLVAFSWICIAFACLVRQNGVVTVVLGALALGWMGWSAGWKRGLAWGFAGLVAPLVMAVGLNAATPVREAPGKPSQNRGVRLVQQYDIAGAIAEDPTRPLPILQAANPRSVAILRRDVPGAYSPQRVDFLNRSRFIGSAFWKVKGEAIDAQWRELIVTDPLGYASRRFQVFRWVLMTPVIDSCLPLHVGVDGPAPMLKDLGLTSATELPDKHLFNYATWWLDTPAYSHGAYAVVALAAAAFLLLRRSPGDVPIAALALASLAFAATFFVISLACDYRYLYFVDLAAITAALYIALDPGRRRRA